MNETSKFGGVIEAAAGTGAGSKRSKKAKRPNLMLQLTDEEDRSKPAGKEGPSGL